MCMYVCGGGGGVCVMYVGVVVGGCMCGVGVFACVFVYVGLHVTSGPTKLNTYPTSSPRERCIRYGTQHYFM